MTNKNTTPEVETINTLLDEVRKERLEQIATWGQQDHESTFGESDRRKAEATAEHWKAVNAARVELDCIHWDGILLEEVFEALAEMDPLLRRQELIQVAAVALGEIEAIDRALVANDPYAEGEDEALVAGEQE